MNWLWVKGYGLRSPEWVRENAPWIMLDAINGDEKKEPAPSPEAQKAFRGHMEVLRNGK